MLDHLPESMSMPVILAGGAGNYKHIAEGPLDKRVEAVATPICLTLWGMGDGGLSA
jgi:imidazole glycerol phosphate synthase subunit HisF